jgi:cellulose biosynthesis protein BcsQ
MKTVVFFNNKGGVGKTTLACNVVSFLNLYKCKRVLLIDADPQCNATQAILSEDECERIYSIKRG